MLANGQWPLHQSCKFLCRCTDLIISVCPSTVKTEQSSLNYLASKQTNANKPQVNIPNTSMLWLLDNFAHCEKISAIVLIISAGYGLVCMITQKQTVSV